MELQQRESIEFFLMIFQPFFCMHTSSILPFWLKYRSRKRRREKKRIMGCEDEHINSRPWHRIKTKQMMRNGGGEAAYNRNMLKMKKKKNKKVKKCNFSFFSVSTRSLSPQERAERRSSRNNRNKNIIIKMTHASTHTHHSETVITPEIEADSDLFPAKKNGWIVLRNMHTDTSHVARVTLSSSTCRNLLWNSNNMMPPPPSSSFQVTHCLYCCWVNEKVTKMKISINNFILECVLNYLKMCYTNLSVHHFASIRFI